MDKLDGTENNIYEVDTSFSTLKRKRPVDRNKEVRPSTITNLITPHIDVQLIARIELAESKIALQKLQSDPVSLLMHVTTIIKL